MLNRVWQMPPLFERQSVRSRVTLYLSCPSKSDYEFVSEDQQIGRREKRSSCFSCTANREDNGACEPGQHKIRWQFAPEEDEEFVADHLQNGREPWLLSGQRVAATFAAQHGKKHQICLQTRLKTTNIEVSSPFSPILALVLSHFFLLHRCHFVNNSIYHRWLSLMTTSVHLIRWNSLKWRN